MYWPFRTKHPPKVKYFFKSVIVACSLLVCLDMVKEAKPRARARPGLPVLVFSSPWDVSTVTCTRETMLRELEPVPQCTWPLLWSTWPLKFLNWQAMLPMTTRRPGSSPVTCNWPSVMMRS